MEIITSLFIYQEKNGDEKLIRGFVINNHKEFPLIDENGNARGKYGLVAYKEKATSNT